MCTQHTWETADAAGAMWSGEKDEAAKCIAKHAIQGTDKTSAKDWKTLAYVNAENWHW